MIYLDNNATTAMDPWVLERMGQAAIECVGNASSQHSAGRQSQRRIDESLEVILRACGCRTGDVQADSAVICSGGTEANNLAVLGLSSATPGSLAVSSIEHPSIIAAAQIAAQRGRVVEWIPVGSDGIVDLGWLERRIQRHATSSSQPSDRLAAVVVMAANNETGVFQPVEQIGQWCTERRIHFHVDAVQLLGKQPVDFQAMQATSMTVCAHKLHGPVGIGLLIHRATTDLQPLIVGGKQQLGRRGGTEAAWLIAGFAAATERIEAGVSQLVEVSHMRDRLESGLREAAGRVDQRMEIVGQSSPRLPNTTCVAFPGLNRQMLQMSLDLQGIACSTGSACESGSSQRSHVLEAMGLPGDVVDGAIRLSLSRLTTDDEIAQTIEVFEKVLPRLRRFSSAG